MVQHRVKHDPDALGVKGITNLLQVLFRTKAAVHGEKIASIVAMGITLKERVKEHAVAAQRRDMIHPVQQPQDAVGLHAVVLRRCSAEPQRVDLIHDRFVVPHNIELPPVPLL